MSFNVFTFKEYIVPPASKSIIFLSKLLSQYFFFGHGHPKSCDSGSWTIVIMLCLLLAHKVFSLVGFMYVGCLRVLLL